MTARLALKLLFGCILVAMLVVTTTASLKQPLWDWSGLVTEPARANWFVAIMLLGNIAMASHVLLGRERVADRVDGGSRGRSCL